MSAFKLKMYEEGDIRRFGDVPFGGIFTCSDSEDHEEETAYIRIFDACRLDSHGRSFNAIDLEHGDQDWFDEDEEVEFHRKEWDRDDESDEEDEDDY